MFNEGDLELVFLDFSEAYQEDSTRAIHMAQALLLDEVVCRQRSTFLKQLGGWAKSGPKHQEVEEGRTNQFAEDIRVLAELGVEIAIQRHLLTPERLSTVLSHPAALLRAHEAMAASTETELTVGRWEASTVGRRRVPMYVERPKSLAAKSSRQSTKVVLLGSKEGHKLEAWASTKRLGHTELRLFGDRPREQVALLVDGQPVDFIAPFDDSGLALVRTSDIRGVLTGKAILELVIAGN